jgi:hypothetical protein
MNDSRKIGWILGSLLTVGLGAASSGCSSASPSTGATGDVGSGTGSGTASSRSGSGQATGQDAGSTSEDAGARAKGNDAAEATSPDAGSTPEGGGLTLAERIAAVNATTTSDSLCTKLGDFYWEIGDDSGVLGSGAVGTTYTESKSIEIASASKFVFGAYMVQSTSGQLTTAAEQELRMLSGYYGLNPGACSSSADVTDCLNAGSPGPNYSFNAAYVGKFYYGGAHDEFFAATPVASGGLGLGADTTADLNALILPVVLNPGFKYGFPEFAGGISSTPVEFAAFLQSIVANKLLLHDFLGVNPVCTLPGSCANAVMSPIPVAWHYSYNHWVEDDPTGDGSFSSPGAFGFYPWITADKKLFGVLAREDKAGGGSGDGDGAGPGYDSAACGLKLRQAWSSGRTQ